MSVVIEKLVDTISSDLKQLYKQDPTQIWDKPLIIVSRRDGGVVYLDNIQSDEHALGWLKANINDQLETLAIGRMVVKRGTILDAMGEPTIKEKGLMVFARNFNTGRTRVVITKINEHRDFRTTEEIEKQGTLFNPGLTSPDVDKLMVGADGKIEGRMLGQFGKEEILGSKNGQTCMMDPIIAGLAEYRNKQEQMLRDLK